LNSLFERILRNSWLELAFRWILGATFIYSSYSKILAPAEFAKIIYGYDLLPAILINLITIIVPILELVIALALIQGIYPRSAATVVNALLSAFIILISINLIRGHAFNCGCFALQNAGSQVSSSATVMRDFIFLAPGRQVVCPAKWIGRRGKLILKLQKNIFYHLNLNNQGESKWRRMTIKNRPVPAAAVSVSSMSRPCLGSLTLKRAPSFWTWPAAAAPIASKPLSS